MGVAPRRPLLALLLTLTLAASAAPAQASVVAPPPAASLDYQLGGGYPTSAEVVVRDRADRPVGGHDVCYVNAFQTQPGELGWWKKHRPRLLLRS